MKYFLISLFRQLSEDNVLSQIRSNHFDRHNSFSLPTVANQELPPSLQHLSSIQAAYCPNTAYIPYYASSNVLSNSAKINRPSNKQPILRSTHMNQDFPMLGQCLHDFLTKDTLHQFNFSEYSKELSPVLFSGVGGQQRIADWPCTHSMLFQKWFTQQKDSDFISIPSKLLQYYTCHMYAQQYIIHNSQIYTQWQDNTFSIYYQKYLYRNSYSGQWSLYYLLKPREKMTVHRGKISFTFLRNEVIYNFKEFSFENNMQSVVDYLSSDEVCNQKYLSCGHNIFCKKPFWSAGDSYPK